MQKVIFCQIVNHTPKCNDYILYITFQIKYIKVADYNRVDHTCTLDQK